MLFVPAESLAMLRAGDEAARVKSADSLRKSNLPLTPQHTCLTQSTSCGNDEFMRLFLAQERNSETWIYDTISF
jgi:hypothetical protein